MPDDIKTLTKKVDDLEKRLKTAEAKIKTLADSMTSSRDIEKFLDVVRRENVDKTKVTERELDLQRKAAEAYDKERRKETNQIQKEVDKYHKEAASQAELNLIKARIATVEALVQAALKR